VTVSAKLLQAYSPGLSRDEVRVLRLIYLEYALSTSDRKHSRRLVAMGLLEGTPRTLHSSRLGEAVLSEYRKKGWFSEPLRQPETQA
jgi:hypothetical protein